ncbi:MAG: hypothetical protein KJ626_05300 [Verrucomicrobia bacterium]|nr:hypothetical protein [Verrucomicrobiota bacterium]
MNTKQLTMTMATALISVAAFAQSPVIDGVVDAAFYGAALASQDTPTTFGDATNGHTRVAIGGSELDQVFARVSDGMLWLFAAGNVETGGQGVQFPGGNRNRLDIFIDSIPGGQNSLRGDNANVDSGGLNRMGHLDPTNDGLKFDTGVEPDFFLTFHNYTQVLDFGPGWGLREIWRGALHYGSLPTGGSGTGMVVGIASDTFPNSYPNEFTLSHGVKLGFRNSNKAGVTSAFVGSPSASDSTNVTTGLELGLPLALLDATNGVLNSVMKITLFINDSVHGYISNQTLGPLGQPSGSYGNLGEPRTWDFKFVTGSDQYVSLSVPLTSTRHIQDTAVVPDSDGDAGAVAVSNAWIAGIGEAYRVDYSTNLLSGIWTNVSGIITADEAIIGFEHTNMTADAAYYRIMRIE